MASFANPFAGNVPRKMTKEELIQAIRIKNNNSFSALYCIPVVIYNKIHRPFILYPNPKLT